jgi:hypothetical protein
MVATVVSGTVSNVVVMIGTEARLKVQTTAMKVQWCVSLIDVLPTSCQPYPVIIILLSTSISSTKQMRRSSRMRTYVSSASNASSHSPMDSQGMASLSTSRLKNYPRVQPSPCVHRAHSTYDAPRDQANPHWATVRAILNAGWPAHIVTLSFLFTPSPTPSWVTS